MRRLLSIAMVLALLSSAMSPLAAACTGMRKGASCHMDMEAEAGSHCDRASHHHHQKTENTSSPSFSADNSDSKCPMDCCTPGHPQSGTAQASATLLPPLSATKRKILPVSVTFVSAGFSSHTDRGPPIA
jgi:hypothetical protein